MTITRTINGEQVSFELTEDELVEVFFEQQYLFDKQDVMSLIEGWDDDDVKDTYGVPTAEYMSLCGDMAAEMRRNMDKYDMDFDYARDAAVSYVVEQYKSKGND